MRGWVFYLFVCFILLTLVFLLLLSHLLAHRYSSMFDETSSIHEPIKELPWFVAQRIVGDYMLFCPGRRAASFLTKLTSRTSPVYEYMFDRAPQNSKSGAYHGAEVAFVFNSINELVGVTADSEEIELAQSMAWMWSVFAWHGTPTPQGWSIQGTTNLVRSLVNSGGWKVWPSYLEMDVESGGGLESKINLRSKVCEDLWDVIRVPVEEQHGGGEIVTPSSGGSGEWSGGTTIAVGLAVTCTMLGLLLVLGMFLRAHLQQEGGRRFVGEGEDYATMEEEEEEERERERERDDHHSTQQSSRYVTR